LGELVLDASIATKWFRVNSEADILLAERLLERHLAGELRIVVPLLLFLELLNAAARRWRWTPRELEHMADRLGEVGFDVAEPSLAGIARWSSRGLTAYDACYVALAEERGVPLVTADERILAVCRGIGRRVGDFV